MKTLPPPGTFAEGQRYIYGLLASAGGMFCGACAGSMVALLMWGGWSAGRRAYDHHHFRLVARRVHRCDGRRDHRPARRRAGRALQGRRQPRRRFDRGGQRNDVPAASQRTGHRRHRRVALPRRAARHPERRHAPLEEESARFERLYRAEQAAFAGRSPTTAPPPKRLAPPTAPMRNGSPPSSAPSTKGAKMILKLAWPLLALSLGACASKPEAPQPIPVLARSSASARPTRCHRKR